MSYKNSFKISDDIIASKQMRFVNLIIDYFTKLFAFVSIIFLIQLFSEFTGSDISFDWIDDMNKIEEYLLGAIVSIIYYAIFESLTARSVGKYVTNTIVVLEDGSKPPIEAILRRTLYRVIPFDALSFLGHNRGWHDKYTDTFVVSKSGLQAAVKRHNDFNTIGQSEMQ